MRPALLDALAVVSPFDLRRSGYLTRHRVYVEAGRVGVALDHAESRLWHRWSQASPADAVAALVEAELLPEHWLDPERAPRWWCAWCEGSGVRWHDTDACASSCFCLGGVTPAPPSHPALVAVASLGADALARAEAIVAETWRARVVWRVMGAAALNDHFSRVRDSRPPGAEVGAALVFALEDREEMGGDAWTAECPYAAPPVRRAWPALRALAALGLHLVAVDDGRVTLAVESV